MRALVTGGAGFIGSHLTEALLAAGHEVTVIDDLSTGRASNLKAVAGNERLTTRWASILQDERLDKFIEQSDVVFHLAAAVGVRLILEKPVDTIEANVLGTDRVLKAAAKAQCTVVIASTSEVYGKNERMPLSEEDDGVFGPTVKSRWSYAVSKAIDEFLGLAYCRDRGVPVVIVRYFNTIGPRQVGRYGMVVPRFVRQAHEARHDHPVAADLTRSDRVEVPDDHDGHAAIAAVRQPEELVNRLGDRVAPAALHGRPEDAVVFLAQWHPLVLAVHLRRRRDHHGALGPGRCLEDAIGPQHVGFDRVDRLLEDQSNADGCCEVEHDVGL